VQSAGRNAINASVAAPAACSCLLSIVVFDFGYCRKRYFDYLTVGAFHFYAGGGEGLSSFHAANDSAHAYAIYRYDLNIVLAVKGLQGSKCFGNFHVIPPGFIAEVANEPNLNLPRYCTQPGRMSTRDA
jgi:hypothetical protein